MPDARLQPVWFNPIGVNALAANLRVQSYNGKPVLSWWQGTVSPAGVTTSGEDVVVDQHYRHVATLKGAGGWVISQHEMVISGANAWVTLSLHEEMRRAVTRTIPAAPSAAIFRRSMLKPEPSSGKPGRGKKSGSWTREISP